MKKIDELENMSPMERRDFLKYVSGFLTLPMLPGATKSAMMEMILGSKAYAQMAAPMNFIEINFRDQWDFGSLFVPPSVAQNFANVRSRVAIFDQPIQERNNFYVTPQAQELRPHLDNIAVMELGECPLPGNESVHGHEAGNPLRSPGRSKTAGAGRRDMATVDRRPGTGGNEVLYSSTPTPLILHNYYQKTLSPNQANGVILRSSIRSDIHTYYHFEANLANAQVDRYFDRTTFLNRVGNVPTAPEPVASNLQRHGALIGRLLKRLDDNYLRRVLASATQQTQHSSKTDALGNLFTVPAPTTPTNITLSATELAYWQNGIGAQVVCPGDDASNCTASSGRWHVGELFGYATKLVQSGRARSIGIDFDMHDIHTNRTPFVMTTQAQQSGMTLARMIQSLKTSGHWESTLIVMYTLDGSRSPISSSTGEDTKNAVVLAGGKIRGGYYGDIQVSNSGVVTYRRPDDNGNPVATGTTGREMRVPAADVYKTVATAAGIPMNVIDSFPDVRAGRLMSYLLRS